MHSMDFLKHFFCILDVLTITGLWMAQVLQQLLDLIGYTDRTVVCINFPCTEPLNKNIFQLLPLSSLQLNV